MLKVLLARHIPEHYLSAPRGDYQGATQLAAAADVSVMSAFRFIEQFSKAGFLEEQRLGLRAVRIEELMNRWAAATQGRASEVGVRWIFRGRKNALWLALRSYVSAKAKQLPKRPDLEVQHSQVPRVRACLGLFAAAEALGLGFVHGVQPYVYLERIEPKVLESLGFSANNGTLDVAPDVYL